MEYKFDQPWDGLINRKLEKRMPSCYRCPADQEGRFHHCTNYFVVVGDQTVFPGTKTTNLKDLERPRNSTILVVEALGQDIHWMEPRDLSFDSMSFIVNDESKPSVSGKHKNGPNVCMVDGTKRRLSNITQEALKEMLMLNK